MSTCSSRINLFWCKTCHSVIAAEMYCIIIHLQGKVINVWILYYKWNFQSHKNWILFWHRVALLVISSVMGQHFLSHGFQPVSPLSLCISRLIPCLLSTAQFVWWLLFNFLLQLSVWWWWRHWFWTTIYNYNRHWIA